MNHPRRLEIGAKKKPTAAKTLWARELLPDIESVALDCGHNAIIRFGRSAGLKLFVTEAGNINHVNDECRTCFISSEAYKYPSTSVLILC
jgi:hypothetical protein